MRAAQSNSMGHHVRGCSFFRCKHYNMRCPATKRPLYATKPGRKYREDRVKKLYEAAALLADRKEQVRMRAIDQEAKLASIERDLAACEQAVGDIRVKACRVLFIGHEAGYQCNSGNSQQRNVKAKAFRHVGFALYRPKRSAQSCG